MTTRSRNEHKTNTNHTKSALSLRGSAWVTTLTLAAATALSTAPAAMAQKENVTAPPSAYKTPVEPTVRQVPQSLVPIFNRAADLLRIAQQRVNQGPASARASYRLAVQDFRQFLAAGGYSPNVPSTDGASVTGNTISPDDAAADLQTLRSARP